MSGDSLKLSGSSPVAIGSAISQKTPSNELPASTPKAVTIFDEPEHIEAPKSYADDPLTSFGPRLHRASISGKKMTGRPPLATASSGSFSNTLSQLRLEESLSAESQFGQSTNKASDAQALLAQVTAWLKDEKARMKDTDRSVGAKSTDSGNAEFDTNPALDKLERILAGYNSSTITDGRTSRRNSIINLRKGSIAKKFTRSSTAGQSSDTEWVDGDISVPHVEASLDNSKTMSFVGGEAEGEVDDTVKQKDQKNWDQFKVDIVRLTHTLKIRGWRRIPIDRASTIAVERLSGALTNAVYVVKPPKELPELGARTDGPPHSTKSRPLELLLRIYGPQVEHLIDRESELLILRRLARKKIGPRLLGYFTNGRFEEFLHAKTLEAGDLRVPDTSKQIAKRMRELHDGIELLPSERAAGPMTFQNWGKWVDRCEKVITWLDTQVNLEKNGQKPSSTRYTRRGLICGVEWPVFRAAVEKYHTKLLAEHGGESAMLKRLVFAHNDTQYGNLMRLDPPGESPLVQPANQHRQLVVIDFEYANANTPGYEFANHFTEWCYNYHHPEKTYACNTKYYPTPAEQYRFMRAYVMHRPQYAPAASATPKLEVREKTNIPDFMLDARTPGGAASIDYDAEEKAREEQVESDIEYLLHETRLWRIANSAQWVAWGIVQAKVPELDDPPKKSRAGALLKKIKGHFHPHSDPLDADVEALQAASKHDRPENREKEEAHAEGSDVEEEEEDFDYLAYSHERAMLFWGDCLQMGIVKETDLPESLLKQVKFVKF